MDIDCMIQSQRHVDMFFEYYTTGARPIVRGAFSAAAWPTPQASSRPWRTTLVDESRRFDITSHLVEAQPFPPSNIQVDHMFLVNDALHPF